MRRSGARRRRRRGREEGFVSAILGIEKVFNSTNGNLECGQAGGRTRRRVFCGYLRVFQMQKNTSPGGWRLKMAGRQRGCFDGVVLRLKWREDVVSK